MNKRTREDWSEHELIIEEYPTHTVHLLKKPNTVTCSVRFTNINGNLIVTGDYSDWIFCREFQPSADGQVSDHYWCEKLTIANHNIQYKHFDTDYTRERIEKEVIESICDCYNITDDKMSIIKDMIISSDYMFDIYSINAKLEEENMGDMADEKMIKEIEYWAECYRSADDEYDYMEAARKYPETMDCEELIFGKHLDYQLRVIFDAFDEICRRMKERVK